jgi:ElaB/YqjD/DUF883 family membrane-anchored ribosome-binding protein
MKNETIRQKTHQSVDKIMDGADNMNEKSREAIARVKEQMILARKNVDDYIKVNPERSVLIAAGIGVALGAIITALIMRKRH